MSNSAKIHNIKPLPTVNERHQREVDILNHLSAVLSEFSASMRISQDTIETYHDDALGPEARRILMDAGHRFLQNAESLEFLAALIDLQVSVKKQATSPGSPGDAA